ncbi:hypothetical protein EDC94DRAFT_611678, partial [Helicostylum pulchrum]
MLFTKHIYILTTGGKNNAIIGTTGFFFGFKHNPIMMCKYKSSRTYRTLLYLMHMVDLLVYLVPRNCIVRATDYSS